MSGREKDGRRHLGSPAEFANVATDPAESVNVAAQHPDTVARLAARARADDLAALPTARRPD